MSKITIIINTTIWVQIFYFVLNNYFLKYINTHNSIKIYVTTLIRHCNNVATRFHDSTIVFYLMYNFVFKIFNFFFNLKEIKINNLFVGSVFKFRFPLSTRKVKRIYSFFITLQWRIRQKEKERVRDREREMVKILKSWLVSTQPQDMHINLKITLNILFLNTVMS